MGYTNHVFILQIHRVAIPPLVLTAHVNATRCRYTYIFHMNITKYNYSFTITYNQI